MTRQQAIKIINRSLRRRNEIVSERYAKRLMKAYEIYNKEHGLCCVECHANGMKQGETTGALVERERILAEIDKLKPFIDEQGQANWFRHSAYVRAIKGVD